MEIIIDRAYSHCQRADLDPITIRAVTERDGFEMEGLLKVVRVVEVMGLISGMKEYGLNCQRTAGSD